MRFHRLVISFTSLICYILFSDIFSYFSNVQQSSYEEGFIDDDLLFHDNYYKLEKELLNYSYLIEKSPVSSQFTHASINDEHYLMFKSNKPRFASWYIQETTTDSLSKPFCSNLYINNLFFVFKKNTVMVRTKKVSIFEAKSTRVLTQKELESINTRILLLEEANEIDYQRMNSRILNMHRKVAKQIINFFQKEKYIPHLSEQIISAFSDNINYWFLKELIDELEEVILELLPNNQITYSKEMREIFDFLKKMKASIFTKESIIIEDEELQEQIWQKIINFETKLQNRYILEKRIVAFNQEFLEFYFSIDNHNDFLKSINNYNKKVFHYHNYFPLLDFFQIRKLNSLLFWIFIFQIFTILILATIHPLLLLLIFPLNYLFFLQGLQLNCGLAFFVLLVHVFFIFSNKYCLTKQ